ncbi:MAG: sigma-70 family RNA polymerase sigma factor [Romboutsia sp.]|uniref:sigma-70 family RNA polymerase sigma factor n=1 Tax=Romboutsia sp. TaxID=1965302 RepID=UPI003F397F22
MKDKLIVRHIKKCNPKGMEMLIDNYSGLLTSVVKAHISPLSQYEEECVSDVLFQIWEKIDSFNIKENSFKNWICAIAKYKAIDYKRKYISKVNTEIDNNTPFIDENLVRLEIKEEIDEILSILNDNDKELFTRYYLNDEKLEEIATDSDTNVTNLHSRLSRGRKKIRKNILK